MFVPSYYGVRRSRAGTTVVARRTLLGGCHRDRRA
jgi:hypothetical protein